MVSADITSACGKHFHRRAFADVSSARLWKWFPQVGNVDVSKGLPVEMLGLYKTHPPHVKT
uniref:Uncharacterized protein n=1 Tax=Arundo donax TaxID=35708 RepID=A0A0A9A4N6_ARUDO